MTAAQSHGRSMQIWLGSGGVGKTTMAAASGVAAALDGERVVVLTIDPARRLADTLGLGRNATDRRHDYRSDDESGDDESGDDRLGNEPTQLDGPWPGEVWAAMLDPAETFRSLIRTHGRADQADDVLHNRLFQQITTALGGVNEYMAAERLHQLHHDPRFDRVIIDTPPSRHAIDFLDSPTRLRNFVDNRLYRALFASRRGLLGPVTAAAQLVLRLTSRVVGQDLVHDVASLFSQLDGLDEGFRQRAVETGDLLSGPLCSYLVVTSARAQPLREANWLADNLRERGRTIDAVVINRLSPFGHEPDDTLTGGRKADRQLLEANLEEFRALARSEDQVIDQAIKALAAGTEPIRVGERHQPVRGIDDLVELAEQLRLPGRNSVVG